jgi:hypothetical protein
MPVGTPKAAIENAEPDLDVEPVRLFRRPFRAVVALSVFTFGMLAGANIAARVMPPVDGAAAYLLHLPSSPWQTR